jgi:adenylate cyclase
VYPLSCRSDNGDVAYLADGLGEALTSELSRFPDLRVIAFCSLVRLAETGGDPLENGARLGVNYLVTGSVHLTAGLARIRLQLLRVVDRKQLWDEQFEARLPDEALTELEGRIAAVVTARIADTHGLVTRTMIPTATSRPVASASAYEAVLRYYRFELTYTPESFSDARQALEQALAGEPDSAIIWAMLAMLYLDAETLGYDAIPGALELGVQYASRAVTLDPQCQIAHQAKAYACLIERDPVEMVASAERMVEINPNSASFVAAAGFWLCIAGQYERGMALFARGTALNPLHPAWLHAAPFFASMAREDYDSALSHANQFELPDLFWGHLMRASAYGILGRREEAERACAKLLELRPDFLVRAREYVNYFSLHDAMVDRILDALVNVGLDLVDDTRRLRASDEMPAASPLRKRL